MSAAAAEEMIAQAKRHLHAGEAARAEALLARVCETDGGSTTGWFMLGATRHRLGRTEAALAAFEQASRLEPGNASLHLGTAALLLELKRPVASLQSCETALALSPGDAITLANTGRVLEELERNEEALIAYARALACDPACRPALINRVALLARLQRLDEALATSEEAQARLPGDADCLYNRADVLLGAGRFAEAHAAFSEAISLAPDRAKFRIGLAMSLAALGEFDASAAQFGEVSATDPDALLHYKSVALSNPIRGGPDPLRIFLSLGYIRASRCDWSGRGNYMANLSHLASETQATAWHGDPDMAFSALGFPLPQQALSRLMRAVSRSLQPAVSDLPRRHASPKKSLLRIGYVSPDFCLHPVGMLIRRVFELHDRRSFEVFGYALAPDDGSGIRRDIRNGCDAFRDVSAYDSTAIARLIAWDGVDILVDLAGYTISARPEIFASRPAPLQVAYLGFPNTLGADYIDYALVDKTVCPPSDLGYWTERPVLLPSSYYIYDNRQRIGEATPSRAELGLPEGATVLCCFNQAWRIEPIMFSLWMRLLERIPDAVLWMLSSDPETQRNLRREARERGVAPERLVFASRLPIEQHLARHRQADLFLDTLVYNAHTTAADALWAGLPVITCPGETMHSRVAASLLDAAGLPELITASLEEYERLAFHLATHPVDLTRIRERLRHNLPAAPLFATERRVREFERAYRMMWQRYSDGLPPESFAVPPLHV